MFNETKAEAAVAKLHPDLKVVDSFRYKDSILVRIEHPDPEEAHYDPFFSVDSNTGEVKEFSVSDEDPEAIARAFVGKAFENRSPKTRE